MIRILLTFVIVFSMCASPVVAYELDMSVDDAIRKKYDTEKLQQDVLNNSVNTSSNNKSSSNGKANSKVPQTPLDFSPTPIIVTKADKVYNKKISLWTTFNVKSSQNLSGYTPKGSVVSFTTTENVYKKNLTIPAGTKFYAEVVNSHPAQVTGNGALLVLKVNSMTLNGETYQVSGRITKAKSKKIFFNNIKGQRQYLVGVNKQIDKGEQFYQKTRRTSEKMADNPILVILSPIPTVVGVVGYAGATVLSPVTALSTKGGNLLLPAGSTFEIKLTDSAYVR